LRGWNSRDKLHRCQVDSIAGANCGACQQQSSSVSGEGREVQCELD
jgi:hypothetical protein